MKTLLTICIFAMSAFGQNVTVAVRVQPNPVQTFTLPAGLVAALNAFMATQTKQDPAFPDDPTKTVPKYVDLADLILTHLKASLFRDAVKLSPPAAIVTKRAERDAKQAELDALEATTAAPLP